MTQATVATLLICGWVVLAQILQTIPSTDNHWRRAYFLIAIGLPLLGLVFYLGGAVLGGIGILVGLAVLRWPVRYGLRHVLQWLRARSGRGRP